MVIIIDKPIIRPITRHDAKLIRELYLTMFADSPNAFGETLGAIQGRTAEDWLAFVARHAAGTNSAAFLAEDLMGACGFVRVEVDDPRTPAGTALVSELWVSPRNRSNGLGRQLMTEAERWAKARGAGKISLGVADRNSEAQGFYQKLGYSDTGIRVPLPANDAREAVVMMRKL